MKNVLAKIFLIAAIAGIGYYFFAARPCHQPISYSLGEFDSRFNISRENLIKELKKAEQGWEEAAHKDLFVYKEKAGKKSVLVNLIYDQRQQTTDRLGDLGEIISQDRAGYERARSEYLSLIKEYEELKFGYERHSDEFEAKKAAYEQKVEYWNSRGGAPSSEYKKLEAERQEINEDASSLNRRAKELNSLAAKINQRQVSLNELAQKLNLKVADFNNIGGNMGEEFSEGEFVSDENGKRINIYQFDDLQKLNRLILHEFGHALGLDHVEDPQAIMYWMNSGKGNNLTKADLSELFSVCQ